MTQEEDFARFKIERPRYEQLAKAMASRAEVVCHGAGIKCRVSGRAKDLHSFAKKILFKSQTYEQVFDKAGIRVVVEYPDERDKAAEIVKAAFKTSDYRKDFIDITKDYEFAYRALHMDGGLLPTDFGALPPEVTALSAEIQIHRPGESLWATVNHDLMYKSTIEVPHDVRRAIHRLSAVLELVDIGFESARGAVLNHPDFLQGAVLMTLERHFLRLTGKPSDPSLSMLIVHALKGMLPKVETVDAFVAQKDETLVHLYGHYAEDLRHALLYQPESLLVWQLLSEQRETELRKAWPDEIPQSELDGLIDVWPTS